MHLKCKWQVRFGLTFNPDMKPASLIKTRKTGRPWRLVCRTDAADGLDQAYRFHVLTLICAS